VFAREPIFRLRADLRFEGGKQTLQVCQEWRGIQRAAIRIALGARQDEPAARAGAGNVAVVTLVSELRQFVWAEQGPVGFELFTIRFGEKSPRLRDSREHQLVHTKNEGEFQLRVAR